LEERCWTKKRNEKALGKRKALIEKEKSRLKEKHPLTQTMIKSSAPAEHTPKDPRAIKVGKEVFGNL
ncbi:hypothetical protein ACXWOQ_10325, partial [Streptococcus pyogenes]